ncbi:MAG: substrate-binding periplasmic protein [Alcanivoracaceae bacterium]
MVRVLLLFLMLVSGMAFALCERPLRVAVEDWPPYQLESEGRWTGIDVERVDQLLRGVGCVAVFMSVPAGRSHLMLERGDIDILMAASDVPERHRYAWFTEPYRQEVMSVFGVQGRMDLPAGFGRLVETGLVLIAPRAGWYGAEYAQIRNELIESYRLLVFDVTPQAVTMLAAGRGDLLLGDHEAVLLAAAELGIELTPMWVANDAPVHLMLSRASLTEVHLDSLNALLRD